MKLTTRVKYLRLINGLTQQDVANRAGCSKTTISTIENTGIPPHPDVIRRLAEAFRVPIKELYATSLDEADPLRFADPRRVSSVA